MGRLSKLVIRALLKRPMTAMALTKRFKRLKVNEKTMLVCLRRLHVDNQAVAIVGAIAEEGCKKPVRLYLATAKGLEIVSKREKK